MTEKVLDVKNLSVSYEDFLLDSVSFAIRKGEILSIIGESGSGKTTLVKAISCLLDKNARVSGEVYIEGKEILSMKERERKYLRMTLFSIVFQNTKELLNPSMTLEKTIKEILNKDNERKLSTNYIAKLMKEVGLSVEDLKRYPNQLSGGMCQKFMIACAIALRPKLIIMDEPTSSLDIQSKKEIIELIHQLNYKFGISFLIITHDLKLASELSTKMIVLYCGHVMEMGMTKDILENPKHPYSRGLIRSSIGINLIKDICGIRTIQSSRETKGCPFYGRCTQGVSICKDNVPELKKYEKQRLLACNLGGILKVLEGINITKNYGDKKILINNNMCLYSGEIVSLVGKSGAGKSTLGNILGGFITDFTSGEVKYCEKEPDFIKEHKKIGGIQMVFQDSDESLNPHMTVWEAVSEPLKLAKENEVLDEYVKQALLDTGLPISKDFFAKRIRNLSGGQKQRINIARALSMKPKLMIADEPTSMLDSSSKANIIRLLKELQNKRGLSMIIISHDFESVLKISDRIYLLQDANLKEIDIPQLLNISIDSIFENIV